MDINVYTKSIKMKTGKIHMKLRVLTAFGEQRRMDWGRDKEDFMS